jgi:hypothetical protein
MRSASTSKTPADALQLNGEAPMPLLDPEVSAKIGTLQMLDDAIAYRLSQLNLPCGKCAPEQRCAEHAHDTRLLDSYQDRYAAAFQDATAGMNPDDIAAIMQPGDDTPALTGALSLAILARLRELASDGPAVTELDGRAVVIELDGPIIIEHPLPSRSDNSAAA